MLSFVKRQVITHRLARAYFFRLPDREEAASLLLELLPLIPTDSGHRSGSAIMVPNPAKPFSPSCAFWLARQLLAVKPALRHSELSMSDDGRFARSSEARQGAQGAVGTAKKAPVSAKGAVAKAYAVETHRVCHKTLWHHAQHEPGQPNAHRQRTLPPLEGGGRR